MARKQKRPTGNVAKGKTARRGTRKGGETAVAACTCEVDLQDDDPIVSFAVSGAATGGFFRPKYAKDPDCTGHSDCKETITYQWTLTSATPAQPNNPPPKIDGETTNPTCRVINPGKITLKLEVRVECARRGEGGVDRLSECSDTGEVMFRIRA